MPVDVRDADGRLLKACQACGMRLMLGSLPGLDSLRQALRIEPQVPAGDVVDDLFDELGLRVAGEDGTDG